MKDILRPSRILPLLITAILPASPAFANTEMWIGNPGVSATTNWSANANWTTLSGVGSPGYTNNDLLFGNGGTLGTDNTISSVVDTSAGSLSMIFTNQSSQFHTILIPNGVTLVNSNGLIVGSNAPAIDANNTKVNFTGGGTLVQNGNITVRNNAVTSGQTSLATLDLSGLSFFVCSNSTTLSVGGVGTETRSAGQLLLAAVSNNITVTTLNLQITGGNGGNNGGANIRLGPGTNIINGGTINIVAGKAVNGTMSFQGATGGLRIRGANGNADDSSRSTIIVCNRNNGGTGTMTGTADFTGGHAVDIKAGTITLGQTPSNPSAATQNGTANLRFDAGTIDAVTVSMANNTVANATTTANLVVGTGGSLVVSNVSLVNQTANTATGNLFIGGTVNCAGGIFKTTLAGTGNITITNGTLTLASGNTVGASGVPIDNLNLTTATLNLSVVNNAAIITAAALNLVDSANTVNIAALPSIGGFPTPFPLATYTSFPGGGSVNLGTLPPGYSGYISNDTVNTLWLVIATGPVAKADGWGGGVNNLWDTTTLNWTNSGVAVNYNDNDAVTFGDSAKTNIINLTAARLPASLTVSNDVLNYTFTGVGNIGGPVTLVKRGNASLTLSETGGDNFSGGITVNGGTLILDNTNSAISGGLMVASGAGVQIGNNNGNGALPAGAVVVDGGLGFIQTNNLTVGTAISGTGAFGKGGSGRLTLTAVQNYTGGTYIYGGTLALTGTATLSNSAEVSVFPVQAFGSLSGAALDLSGVTGPTTLNSLLVASNASMSIAMPNVTTPVSVTALRMIAGHGYARINVTALPPIASYPVTLTLIQSATAITIFDNPTLGTLPPSYAGSIALSPDQTAVQLTLTTGPIGQRPFVTWSGGGSPVLNWTERLNWQLPGAPVNGDNVIFAGTATGADAITVNNIANAGVALNSLTYSNSTSGQWHVTQIPAGGTLAVTNFTVGGLTADGVTTTAAMVDGGTLLVTGNFTNGNSGLNAIGSSSTLDLAALSNFVQNSSSGVFNLGSTGARSQGNLNSPAASNSITVASVFFETSSASSSGAGTWNLSAGTNRINANTINIGAQRSSGTIQFNTPTGGVRIRGTGGTDADRANMTIGNRNAGGTSGTANGRLLFDNHPVDIKLGSLTVGQCNQASPVAGVGVVQFNTGTVDATNINMAICSGSSTATTGTITVGTNSTSSGNGTLIVSPGGISLVNQTAGAAIGTLNVAGGVVNCAGNIAKASANGTGIISVTTGGTLQVGGVIGTPAAPIDTLTLDSAALQLKADGSAGVATVVATAIAASGTTTVNIGSIVNVSSSNTIPLISYAGANPFSSLSLGTYPAGHTVVLVDNTASSTIDLSIVPPAARPIIGNIAISGGNVIISGTNGTAGADYFVLASTNVALPVSNWTRLQTNQFGIGGGFAFTNAVDPNFPRRFYRLQLP